VSGQEWPTEIASLLAQAETWADPYAAANVSPHALAWFSERVRLALEQVAAREKAAAEKAWDEGQLAGCENLAGSFHGRAWTNPYRADVLADEGER
jgi:hypothetical protein